MIFEDEDSRKGFLIGSVVAVMFGLLYLALMGGAWWALSIISSD